MSANIEERVVQMRFDNKQFEQGAEQSLRTLDKLENVLDQLGSGGGLEKIGTALDSLQSRFSAFGIAGMAAIENITASVMRLAANMLTAIPNQIISGGKNRALNIEQAKFQLSGLGVAWEDIYDNIDKAVAGTAYGLDEAAVVASQLAASGVAYGDAQSDMAKALRGISGVAAMTNSSYAEIGHIFAGISGTGHVMTQDLRMLEGRGLNVAAKLADVLNETTGTAQYTEATIRDMVSKGQIDFLTFARAMDFAFGEHATKANETYTGSLANMKAALSRIGADFAMPLLNSLRDVQNALRNTFNNVRKITRPFAENEFTAWLTRITPKIVALVESADFSWLEGLMYMLKNINTSGLEKALNRITTFNKTLHDFFHPERVNDDLSATNHRLDSWMDPKAVRRINNLKDAFDGLKVILYNVRDFFQVVGHSFDKVFGKDAISKGFFNGLDSIIFKFGEWGRKLKDTGRIFIWLKKSLSEPFTMKDDWMVSLTRAEKGWLSPSTKKRYLAVRDAFDALFTIIKRVGTSAVRIIKAFFDIGKTIVNDVLSGLKKILPGLGGGFLTLGEFVASASEKLAEWVENLRDAIAGNKFFSGILDGLASAFQGIHGFVTGAAGAVKEFLRSLFSLKEGETFWSKFGGYISTAFDTALETLRNFHSRLKETFGENGLGSDVLKIAMGILAVFLGYRKLDITTIPAIKNFGRTITTLKDGLGAAWKKIDVITNLPNKINIILSKTIGAFRAFTDNLNAQSIFEIAKAIALLAVGLWVLASIDVDKLAPALGAVAAVIGELVGSLLLIYTVMNRGRSIVTGFTKISTDGKKGLDKLATTFKNLGGGVKNFFMNLMPGVNKLLESMAIKNLATSLLYIAAAVLVLAIAVKIFSTIEFGDLAKGLLALAVSLGVLVGALYLITKFTKELNGLQMIPIGIAILLISISVIFLAGALVVLSMIPFEKILVGLLGLVVGLAAIAVAIGILSKLFLPKDMLAAGAAMALVSIALVGLAAALLILSLIPVDKMLVGLLGLAVGLTAIALAIDLLCENCLAKDMLAAAASILIVSIALVTMAAALLILSIVPFDRLVGSFVALALTLAAVVIAIMVVGDLGPVALAGAAAILIVSIALIGIAAALLVFAVTLKILEGVNIVGISLSLIALFPALILFGAAGLILGLGAPGLLVGAAGLLVLAVAFKMFNASQIVALSGALILLVPALLALGAAGLVFGLGGPGLAIGGGGLLVLGLALNMYTRLDLVSISAGLTKLGAALIPLGTGGIVLGLGAAGLIAGGLALIPFAFGLECFADGMHAMADVSLESMLAVATGVAAISVAGLALTAGAVGLLIGAPALKIFGEALPPLAEGIRSFDGINWSSIGKTFGALAVAISGLLLLNFTNASSLVSVGTGIGLIADGIARMPADATTRISGIGTAVSDMSTAIGTSVTTMIDHVTTKTNDGLTKINEKLNAFFSVITIKVQTSFGALRTSVTSNLSSISIGVSTMAGTLSTTLSRLGTDAYTYGYNVSVGFANGINAGSPWVRQAVQNINQTVTSTFRRGMQIASPSKVARKLAGYIPEGISLGIMDGQSEVEDSMITVINPILLALESLMNGDFDISPSITPVVDLTNAQAMSGELNSMFNGSGTYAVDAARRIAGSENGNGSGFGNYNNVGDTVNATINVYAQPGQDVNELATVIERRLVKLNKQQRLGAL